MSSRARDAGAIVLLWVVVSALALSTAPKPITFRSGEPVVFGWIAGWACCMMFFLVVRWRRERAARLD